MPGGYGNITPQDGKQFSKEYQPDEKWTEEKSLQLGNDLISWLSDPFKKNIQLDDGSTSVIFLENTNIFYEDFLIIERGLYPELIFYLSNKFTSFSKLIEKAKKIQEIKLIKYGVTDKLNAQMTKFVLTNNHGYKDKTDITSGNEKLNIPILNIDPLSDK